MPMKDWIYQLQPVQLYVILTLSICYFILQLFLSHITHALTLLMDAYHMLCNIIALAGCILTIKHSKRIKYLQKQKENQPEGEVNFMEVCLDSKMSVYNVPHSNESKLHNTFGWTRIDILTMLIVCIFLASLSFSLLVEALQTLVHIDHQDTMHLPVPVFILGAMGLVLNGLCYLLIGGYTMHQGSFFHVTSSGDVILENVSSGEDLKAGSRRLSKSKRSDGQQSSGTDITEPRFEPGKRQGPGEMFRDICSSLFVMICAIIVYFADDEQISKFIDPIISIISCVLLLVLSYPYMKESCLILLQTIPASIDIEQFKITLLKRFTEIVSVHDLHVWQLTGSKYFSTAHIIFLDPKHYARSIEDVINFFHEQGITNVTIQPEFKDRKVTAAVADCYLSCSDVACAEKHCCRRPKTSIDEIIVPKENTEAVIKSEENADENKVKQKNGEKSKSTVDLNTAGIETGDNNIRKCTSDTAITAKETVIENNGKIDNKTHQDTANSKAITQKNDNGIKTEKIKVNIEVK